MYAIKVIYILMFVLKDTFVSKWLVFNVLLFQSKLIMSPKGEPKTGEKLNKIKDTLTKQGRSQRWLAKELDIHFTTIAAWCNNLRQPTLTDLNKIAEILDVNIKDLLYDTK
jgi:putative transcriptional regulator